MQKWYATGAGLILLAGLLCWIAPAKSDEIDKMREQDVGVYCMSEAKAWEDGFSYAINGADKVIKNISRAEAIKRHSQGEDPPLDGMYYFEWDDYTVQEKEWIERNVFSGWDQGDLAKTNPNLNPELIERLKQAYYEQCLYNESARRTNRDKMKETFINKT